MTITTTPPMTAPAHAEMIPCRMLTHRGTQCSYSAPDDYAKVPYCTHHMKQFEAQVLTYIFEQMPARPADELAAGLVQRELGKPVEAVPRMVREVIDEYVQERIDYYLKEKWGAHE